MPIKLPKLNERLISRVMAHIKKFPASYYQNTVAESCEVTKRTPCGAIGCFGGWAVMLGMPKKERSDRADGVDLNEAQDLVGLTSDEAAYLFDTASGNPRRDYKTIQGRLSNIRSARKIAKTLQVVGLKVAFEGSTLGYGNLD